MLDKIWTSLHLKYEQILKYFGELLAGAVPDANNRLFTAQS